jgi:tetratricopeptide (TPR) repeat protein
MDIAEKGKKMKQFMLLFALAVLISSCATTQEGEYHGQQEGTTGDNIKLIDPVPMVAPSKNEKAMSLYTLGTRSLEENKLGEAEKYLKEALDLDPLFVDAMDHLGMVYRRQNRLHEAEEIYLKSIELNNENTVACQNLAVVYRMQNRLNDAMEMYKRMMRIDSNNPEAYYGIGELFYIIGDYEASMPYFDKAIALYIERNSPLVYDACFYKGMMYFNMNKYDEALKYLREAQKGNPNNAIIERTISEIINTKT